MQILVRQEEALYQLVDGEFECAHESTTIEDSCDWEGNTTGQVYVCDNCDEVTDGSPAEDRADALADMAVMESLGK